MTFNRMEMNPIQGPQQQTTHPDYRYYQLFNSMDEGYCVIELLFDNNGKPCDYRFLEVNAAFERHTGLENAAGKRMRELAPTHEQYWFDIYGSVAVSGTPQRFQNWAEQLGRHYDVYAFRIGMPEEKKVAVLFSDVTEKKRAEDNISFLFDITQSLIHIDSLEETIQLAGAKMGKFLQLSYFIFSRIDLKRNTTEIIYNWHAPHLPELAGVYPVDDYLGGGIQFSQQQGELTIVYDTATDKRVDGSNYKNLGIGSFIRVPLKRNGEWQFCITVCRDTPYNWRSDEVKLVRETVTNTWTSLERKRMEKDLAFSEERLRLAVETGKIGICDFNYQSGVSFSNPVRYVMYGMQPNPQAVPVSEFFARTHPDDVEALSNIVTTGIETEGRFTAEFRVVHPDGSIHWIAETGNVIEWENEKPSRVICTLLDVTERKTVEKQKDDFFSIASHELKTPVTAIKSFTYLLEEKFKHDNDVSSEELAKQLNGQVNRLNKLISNMLDTGKAVSGRLDYHMAEFDCLPVLEEVVREMQYTTKTHAIRLSSPSPLPPVYGDKLRLRQVFINLISNAIKYTPASPVQVPKQISIDAACTGNELRIAVADSGIGISAGAIANLFQRFFRSDTPEDHHYPGLGLGLFISKEIMVHHGGTIYVQSQKGKGSVFTIVLPVANDHKFSMS